MRVCVCACGVCAKNTHICMVHPRLHHTAASMLADKPEHSLLLPDLVVADLLPGRFPSDKGRIQSESLQWLLRAIRSVSARSSLARATRGIASGAQPLWECEVADSRHATAWAASVLESSIRSAASHVREERVTLFADVALPLMRNLVFRGDEEKLVSLLQTLRFEFDQVLNKLTYEHAKTKTQVLLEMARFEKCDLPRHARTTVSRALARCKVHFGGMVYACAFSLALLRLSWAQRKLDICIKMRIFVTKVRS